jgi:LemA protein
MFMWIVLGIVLVIGLWAVGIYNGLIKLKNRTDEAWSDIGVQMKRRFDLIPNLVETVKGYATHEQGTLDKVIQARNTAMGAKGAHDLAVADNQLSQTLKSIFALSEAYPDLKANTNFLHLQQELTDTEDKLSASRRFYNGNVRDLNTKLQVFPDNLIAGMLGFAKREFFEVEEAAKAAPQVKF